MEKNKKLTRSLSRKYQITFLTGVYMILVKYGGASIHPSQSEDGSYEDRDMEDFIRIHLDKKYPCKEYRFQGLLGFGGKYRSEKNKVDYYSEDKTDEKEMVMKVVNKQLELWKMQFEKNTSRIFVDGQFI